MCFRAGAVLVRRDSSKSGLAAVCDGPSVGRCDSRSVNRLCLVTGFGRRQLLFYRLRHRGAG